jgi:hypothetical protein
MIEWYPFYVVSIPFWQIFSSFCSYMRLNILLLVPRVLLMFWSLELLAYCCLQRMLQQSSVAILAGPEGGCDH